MWSSTMLGLMQLVSLRIELVGKGIEQEPGHTGMETATITRAETSE